MMFKKTKRIIFFFFMSCFLLAALFYNALSSTLATWFFQAYTVSQWGKPFHYDSVSLEGSKLVIIKPRFEKGSIFSAEKLVLSFDFDWWKQHLNIGVAIDQPHWHLKTPIHSEVPSWDKFMPRKEKWIKTHPSFHVDKGLLTWSVEDGSQHSLKFDLEGNSHDGGFIKLYFDPDDHESNFLTLQALSTAEEMEVSCNCQEVCCSSLISFTQLLGMDLSPWSLTDGSVKGELKAFFPIAERPHLEGELMFDQLAFIQSAAHLQGYVEQACLKVEKNKIAYEGAEQVPTIICQLDILKPASLSHSSQIDEWRLDQILGSIKLNGVETALIALEAQGGNPTHLSQWNLQGIANLNAQRSLNLDLTLLCSSSDQPDSKVHLFLHQPKQGFKQAKIQLNQMAYRECGFLQALLAPFLPVLREFELEQGVFDAVVEADILNHKIGDLYIKNFRAHHLKSKLHSWNAQCSFDNAWGTSKIHLGGADFWDSLNLELHVENGEFLLDDLTPSLPLKGIQANLMINEGHVEHSLVTLQLAGLKGILDFEWGNSKQLLTLKLDGTAQDLTELLPSAMQDGFRQHFENNRLTILANLKKSKKQQLDLDGSLHIHRAGSEQKDEIHFGCELKKNDGESKSKLIPLGWFYAHKLPLEKFLSPFIFRNGKLKMSGEAEFKGTFDDHYLTIKYDAENLKIENDLLCMEIKQLLSSVPGQLLGSHTIDLETHLHHGTLPIQQGSYYAKTTGLLFQDIQGLVSFENDSISISPLECYCEGVYFAGTLDMDYSDPHPGIFNLSIRCPTLSGKISQIQRLLTHLDSSALLNIIPLEGEISTKGEGLTMDFAFIPNDYDLRAEFHGMIFDGSLPFDSTDMALKGIYMNIDYRHLDQLLEFSDIQGTLLIGKPRLVEEYPFTGSHIRIQNLENPNLSLNVSVRDDDQELFRLCCHSQDEEDGFKSMHIDSQHSHLSGIYSHQSHCLLKDWCSLEKLEFKSNFDVGILFQDLQRFHKTGLLFFSPQIIDKLAQFSPFEGEGSFDLYYHPAERLFTYQIESSKIKQGVDQQEHFGLIQGRKQDKKWILDHLQWDDWNIYAELQQSEDHWKIPFLGLKAGSSFLLGLEGEVNPDRGFLRAKLNLCEIDLGGLGRWEEFRPFIAKWRPKGRLRSSGEIEWYFLADDPMSSLKGELQAEGSELTIREYPLQVHPFLIDIQPNLGCCIRNVQFELFPNDSQAMLHILQLDFHLNQSRLHCPQFRFQIPSTQLMAVGQKLHQHFPEILTHSLKNLLVASKTEGDLCGNFSFDQSDIHRTMHLKLDDGQYCFKNRAIDLKDCEVEVNGNQLHFSALSQHERCLFQILGEAAWPSFHQGHCTLIDLMGAHPSSNYHPLVLEWKNHPVHGFSLRSAHGDFSGCTVHLNVENSGIDSKERTVLQGEVAIDFNSLSHLLPVDASESIQKLKIGSLYRLKGLFWMKPELGNNLLETTYFRGICESFDPILKGFQLEKLTADLQYAPGRLDVQDLEVDDTAGNAYAASLSVMIDPQTAQWTMFMPRIVVKNFRPFSLRDVEASSTQTASKFRSLIVKRAEIEDFYGEVGDLGTWQGHGVMHFLNPSRKNINHPLLAIPAEIILRLGLDPKVLNPVTGTINFDLREDRFYFTRFKDVYSEGRGSKFYLADGPTPSWMDFEGNLSLQIRMKQYNLIFKIAELFTVSVQGNIKKPTYTLQKQNKNSHKGRMQPLVYAD